MKKKGMSLIVLAISVIIMLMLSAVIVMSLRKDNSIEHAKEARFKQEMEDLVSSLKQSIATLQIKNSDVNPENVNETSSRGIKKYIPTLPNKYVGDVEIYKGNLIYVGTNTNEKKWATELGLLKSSVDTPTDTIVTNVKSNSKYNCPYVPSGFSYVGGNYTEGLVISDDMADYGKGTASTNILGNEFVWIPVNKRDVTFGMDYTDDPFSYKDKENISAVEESVQLYGGFYIARYEASASGASVAFKRGKTPLTNVSYTDALNRLVTMYTDSDVICTLPYGAMWDTACKWFIVTNDLPKTAVTGVGGSYGTYGYATVQNTGKTVFKNIGDIGGNVEEWTRENKISSTDKKVARGGTYQADVMSINSAFGFRNSYSKNYKSSTLGYRAALYIK